MVGILNTAFVLATYMGNNESSPSNHLFFQSNTSKIVVYEQIDGEWISLGDPIIG